MYPFALWKDVFAALKPETLAKKILLVGSEDQRGSLQELEMVLKEAEIAGAVAHIPADLVDFSESDRQSGVDSGGGHRGCPFCDRP